MDDVLAEYKKLETAIGLEPKVEIDVGEEWMDIGREYMRRAREADPFLSFIRGFAHTNSYVTIKSVGKPYSAKVINTTKLIFKDPEHAKYMCDTKKDWLKKVIPDFRSKDDAIEWICHDVNNWEHIEKVINKCKINPKSTDEVREELKRLKDDNILVGFGNKGIDMLLLDSGCDTTVLDVWMFEEIYGFDRREEEKEIRDIQNSNKYHECREEVESILKENGVDDIGAWHVATWLKLTTGGDINKARRFIYDLFAEQTSLF